MSPIFGARFLFTGFRFVRVNCTWDRAREESLLLEGTVDGISRNWREALRKLARPFYLLVPGLIG